MIPCFDIVERDHDIRDDQDAPQHHKREKRMLAEQEVEGWEPKQYVSDVSLIVVML